VRSAQPQHSTTPARSSSASPRSEWVRAEAGFEMLAQQVQEYLRFFGFDAMAQVPQEDLSEVRALLNPR
jgi:shikimate dehydrogenase